MSSNTAITVDSNVTPATGTRPFAPFEWQLAFRYLRAKRKESFISVISAFSLVGIALGVATLIIVMSVMNGFRADLMDRILGVKGHIKVYGVTDGRLHDFDALAQKIRTLPDVVRVAPIVEGQAMISAGTNNSGVVVWGMRPEDLATLKIVSDNIVGGDISQFGKEPGILIGDRLARYQLGVYAGNGVTLISPDGAITLFGRAPKIMTYPVQALFSIGVSEYDATVAILPLDVAQVYFNKENSVSYLDVTLTDPDLVGRVEPQIEQLAGQPVYLRDWREENKTFFDALVVERNVMFIILTLIILVAAFNIISGLIMLVKDKGQDIAILRSMGVTRGSIMRVFCMTGSVIGIVGTAAGVVLGILFAANIEAIRQALQTLLRTTFFDPTVYYLSEMPSQINPHEVIAIVIMSLALSFLATLFPAWRAARLDPVEALRYE